MAFLEATRDVEGAGYLVFCRIFRKPRLGLDLYRKLLGVLVNTLGVNPGYGQNLKVDLGKTWIVDC
jgi:hypothetical protein